MVFPVDALIFFSCASLGQRWLSKNVAVSSRLGILAVAIVVAACLASRPAADKVSAGNAPQDREEMLRAKKWRFASYFKDVRRRIRAHWQPHDVMKRLDPDRTRQPSGTWKTLLELEFDESGMVVTCRIRKTSGVPALDNHAVQAVLAAQPFPPPLPQLLNEHRRMSFQFGFDLDLGPSPSRSQPSDAGTGDAGPG
jgi:TonB family protein